MDQEQEFSQAEYDYYRNLGQQERDQLLENEQTPDSIRVLLLVQQGKQLAEKGELDAAIASYEHVLNIEPNHYEAWIQKGNSLRLLNRDEEAIANYDKALEINSNYYWARARRGIC